MSVLVGQMQLGISSRRIHYWCGQQDILGTIRESYQCDQLAQWQIGQSGKEFQFCRAAGSGRRRTQLQSLLLERTCRGKRFHFNASRRLPLRSQVHYDALARSESACLGLKDKRSGLEALSLKRSLVETRCGLRWTHSAAQLADCMTNGSEEAQKPFELLKPRVWKWRLVYDPSFTSARKRAQKGHDVLDYLPSSRTEEEFLAHQP